MLPSGNTVLAMSLTSRVCFSCCRPLWTADCRAAVFLQLGPC